MEFIWGFLGVTWLAIFWVYKREDESTKLLVSVVDDVDSIWNIADENHYEGNLPSDGTVRDYRNLRERVEDIEEAMIRTLDTQQRQRIVEIILERNEGRSTTVVGENWLRRKWLVDRT